MLRTLASSTALVTLLLSSPPTRAALQAEPDPTLEPLIRAGRLELSADEDAFGGPGIAWLAEQGRAARFFVLGESHGNRETPALCRALLPALARAGYGACAIETGPESTRLFIDVLAGGGMQAAEELLLEMPHSLAFLQWRGERELLAAALEHDYAIWGIDQEFIGSARLLLARLQDIALTAQARSLCADAYERAEQGFLVGLETGDRSQGFLSSADADDFAALAAAFADGPPEGQRIVSELAASARVYAHYAAGRYYENNHDRIRLMKRHLVERLDADADQRVLIKLGGAHAGRGYSPYDQLDVGNLAAELAFASGSDSFHLSVFARHSTRAGTRRDFAEGSAHLAPFYAQLEDQPCVFDLRPLRPWASARRESSPTLHSLVFRFDALLLFPDFHGAEALYTLPE